MADIVPSSDRFHITTDNLPHGFCVLRPADSQWFKLTLNSDIRRYYRMICNESNIPYSHPIGQSGITIGELALYIIRTNHSKRRKRY